MPDYNFRQGESGVLTVTQLNEYVRMMFDGNPYLRKVTVKGEISNLTNHSTGVKYLSLKDADSVIGAIVYRSNASKLKFQLQNGMRVLATGYVSSYVKNGVYQLVIQSVEPDGIGALAIAYEQLKNRLESEGLFEPSRKRTLPKYPEHIGVITSPTGAAVRDIINITGRRYPIAEIMLYPALVQGDGAAESLCAGMDYFNTAGNVDVIIIGRGGGSIEDLWAFNDERLARKVASSSIPVISAVGHETDFTICDFVADRRAPTPSAAAELAVPDSVEFRRKLNNVIPHMQSLIFRKLENNRKQLKQLSERKVMQSPSAVIDDKALMLANMESRLTAAQKININKGRTQFTALTSKLEAMNPMSVITRGYGAIFKPGGEVIKSVDGLSRGEHFIVRLSDGSISGTVDEILKGHDDV